MRLVTIFTHGSMQRLCITLSVHKNNGLGHAASVEYIHDKIGFLPGFAAVEKLLYVVQLQRFLLDCDLLSFCNDFLDLILHRIGVGRAEKNELNFLFKLA